MGCQQTKLLNENCTKWRLKFDWEKSDIRQYFLMVWEHWVSSVQGKRFCQYFKEDLSCLFQPLHLSCWPPDFCLPSLNFAFGNMTLTSSFVLHWELYLISGIFNSNLSKNRGPPCRFNSPVFSIFWFFAMFLGAWHSLLLTGSSCLTVLALVWLIWLSETTFSSLLFRRRVLR